MLKKQMLLMLMAGCMVSDAFAEGQEALQINIFASSSEGSTDKVQGIEILDILHGYEKIPANVSVVGHVKHDSFFETKKLCTFNQKELAKCNWALIPPVEDEAILGKLDRKHLWLVSKLRNGECVLCMNGDEEVIVATVFSHPIGAPEKVCEFLKRSNQRQEKLRQEKEHRADKIQEQANKNAGMTSRAYYSPRNAAGK